MSESNGGIVRLEIKNYMGVELFVIVPDPNGNYVVIGGMNGQGKSSVMKAIQAIIEGMKGAPPQPVREGCDYSEILLETDEIIVTQKITAKTKRVQLVVSAKDGKRLRSPQAILDNLMAHLSFDPVAFGRMPSKDQADQLRDLVGLDLSDLDNERAVLYEDRTIAGREVKRVKGSLESMPKHKIERDEIDIAAVSEEMQKRQMQNAGNDKVRERLKASRDGEAQAAEYLKVKQGDVDQAVRELKYAQEKLEKTKGYSVHAATELGKKKEAVEAYETQAGRLVDLDLSDLQAKMASAEEHNVKVRENELFQKTRSELHAAERKHEGFQTKIHKVDEERERRLAAAEFPVEGLGFDENGVTMQGLPFEQASDAEKLRVSVAMGLALNPKLKVILVRDGSLLDDKSLSLVYEMAKAAKAHVWIERVGEGKECTVIMEEGRIKNIEAEVVESQE
ncbi:hypothetical protein LCGC14_0817150 [marine sediment metagenome]|uniref:Rad50/SbcC-type AAA domain-containing protein n=1 Tax=marine sediment metagenome TaxID=412755 RepID=A0A0F9PPK4_9ZZZZ